MARDPRFDELSGSFNQEMFDKAYSFLDDVKANEKKVSNWYLISVDQIFFFYCNLIIIVIVIIIIVIATTTANRIFIVFVSTQQLFLQSPYMHNKADLLVSTLAVWRW